MTNLIISPLAETNINLPSKWRQSEPTTRTRQVCPMVSLLQLGQLGITLRPLNWGKLNDLQLLSKLRSLLSFLFSAWLGFLPLSRSTARLRPMYYVATVREYYGQCLSATLLLTVCKLSLVWAAPKLSSTRQPRCRAVTGEGTRSWISWWESWTIGPLNSTRSPVSATLVWCESFNWKQLVFLFLTIVKYILAPFISLLIDSIRWQLTAMSSISVRLVTTLTISTAVHLNWL